MNAPARQARSACDNIKHAIVITKNELASEKRQLKIAKQRLHDLQHEVPPNREKIAEAKAEVARLEEEIPNTTDALATLEGIFSERCQA